MIFFNINLVVQEKKTLAPVFLDGSPKYYFQMKAEHLGL